MSAETTSGLAAQTGMTAGGAPTGGRALLGAFGGRGRGGTPMQGDPYIHNLKLELGSPRRAAKAPAARSPTPL